VKWERHVARTGKIKNANFTRKVWRNYTTWEA